MDSLTLALKQKTLGVDLDKKIAQLIDKIREVFADSQLYDSYTLRKCAAVDSRVELNHPDLSGISQCQKWQDIPDSDMHLFGSHGVFSHSGEINSQFYLPPAMIYILKNYHGELLSRLDDIVNATECAIKRAHPLSKEQKETVKDFLEWLSTTKP